MNITLLYLLKHIIQLVQTISNNPITILKSFFLSYTIIIPFLKLISLDYNFIFFFFFISLWITRKNGGGGRKTRWLGENSTQGGGGLPLA